MSTKFDAIVIGGGHNGLVAASYLARAGRSVLVLERAETVGGAVCSETVFPGYDARLSKYSYLVSLLPQQIIDELGLSVELLRRRVSSYTPVGDGGLLIDTADPSGTDARLGADAAGWHELYASTTRLAEKMFPTMLQPLRSRDVMRRHVADEPTWDAVMERPIGGWIEQQVADDTVRGVVLTDALIGTFSHAHALDLAQNRCFLYHVIGGGTGHWDVPVGGMGTVAASLFDVAIGLGVTVMTDADVTSIDNDGQNATIHLADGRTFTATQVLGNVAPTVLDRLLGQRSTRPTPEGAQLKVNMLLSRLPALRDRTVDPRDAFAGTFHINETYSQLQAAYEQALGGDIPDLPPCEVYCHSLTDPSILGPDLVATGAQTLTLFGLHLPARLFESDPAGALERATHAVRVSLDSVLAEPIEDCLLAPECIEVMGPLEVEANLGMPGGNIFHGDLQWPFADDPSDEGRWGTETLHPNVFVCGAGARRGGGVSGVPGHNAAMAALAARP
ncbi:MAG: NAD(P)/FAD-dependent oxidoreductase [Ilumatobacteraceae bacterium]